MTMVTEIVLFDLAPGTTRAEAVALYRQSAPQWLGNADLIEKYYFFDEERGLGGGVYFWRSRAAAQRWHGEDYRRMVEARYGAPPRIEVLDALLHVVPAGGRIAEV